MIDFFSLPQEKKDELVKRLKKNTNRDTSGCWNWHGSLTEIGYGRLFSQINGKCTQITAHRLAWVVHYNTPIPKDLHCCHSCDNRKCVRPEHIFIGTPQHNKNDSVLKGRSTPPKVSLQKRFEIAEAVFRGKSTTVVAREYGLTAARVSRYLKSKPVTERYGKIDLKYRAIHACDGRPLRSFPSLI